MEVWIQRSLFDEAGLATQPRISLSRNATTGRRRLQNKVDRTRVTRDPAVAISHAAAAAAACDFRLGLARAFGALSPEQRAALRAALVPNQGSDSPLVSNHPAPETEIRGATPNLRSSEAIAPRHARSAA